MGTRRDVGVYMTNEIGSSVLLLLKECLLPVSALAIFSISMIREFLNSLFKVHRSKTMVRKITSKYSLLERMILKYAYVEPLHAKNISKFGVFFHGVNICFIVMVYFVGFLSIADHSLQIQYTNLISLQFYCFNVPTIIIYFVLKVDVFSRSCHKWKFEKYHTSKEFNKLW